MTVTHATFTLERNFSASPARVFDAWSDPDARRRWFAKSAEYEQDFRVGGGERVRAKQEDGQVLAFESTYHDIAMNERIMYSARLTANDQLWTVSATSVEFSAADGGTLLVLTEHGMYLPGGEKPEWREQGTSAQLDALAAELE